MKFTVEKSVFLKLLSGVYGVASKKNPNNLAILQNIKMETRENFLYLVGTDSDTYIKNCGQVAVDRRGSTTVSAQLIYDIVRKMEDGAEICCDYAEGDKTMAVKSGKSTFKLMCLGADGYPNFEEQQMQSEFKIKLKDLVTIIEKTKFSISDDISRYYLNGLFLHTVEENGELKLTAVSTDGHKLSVVKLESFEGTTPINGVIIPKKALPEIKKMVSLATQNDVIVSLSGTKIKFETENIMIISKLIDAEFPDYRRVIPTENKHLLKVSKREIGNVIDRVATVTNDSHRGIKFTLHDNNLVLEAHSSENGTADEEMKVDFNYSDKIEIGFNSRFFLD
ncbi:MAG: DNA polymerase III subunit beta, partial [Rickettsiales bacterium]|nr:DNA polymerase III subunit beta [Rickettsiales bacterium]